MKRQSIFLLAACCGIMACNQSGVKKNGTTDSSATQAKQDTALDVKVVWKKLFPGSEMNDRQEIVWEPQDAELDSVPVSADGKCYTIVDSIYYFRNNHNAAVLFATYEKDDRQQRTDCHVCAPMFSYAVYRRNDAQGWEEVSSQKQFVKLGAFGQANRVRFEQVGKDRYAFNLSGSYMGQGIIESWLQFFDPEAKAYLSLRQTETVDNTGFYIEGDKRAFAFKWSYAFIPSDKSYWDVSLKTDGTRPDKNGNIKPVKTEETLHFNEQKREYAIE